MASTTKADEDATAPGYGDQGPAGGGRDDQQSDAAETEQESDSGGED